MHSKCKVNVAVAVQKAGFRLIQHSHGKTTWDPFAVLKKPNQTTKKKPTKPKPNQNQPTKQKQRNHQTKTNI